MIDRPWEGFVAERRFALAQVRTPWTLMIDADEALDDRLRAAVVAAGAEANGYRIRRTTYYCGRALRMWRNELLLRLFRTQGAHVEAAPTTGGSAHLHERWECDPPVGTLAGTLLHYSYPTHAAYAAKYDWYTSIEARGLPPSRARVAVELVRALPRFAWYALARGALADGRAGVRVAWLSALYPAMVRIKAFRHPEESKDPEVSKG